MMPQKQQKQPIKHFGLLKENHKKNTLIKKANTWFSLDVSIRYTY